MRRFFTQALWDGRPMRFAAAALLSLGIAFVANAATPRSLCACSGKRKSYIADVKADLRNLVTAQEQFFADSGRYAASEEELPPLRIHFFSEVEFASLTAWGNGFGARVRHPSGGLPDCWITVGPLPDGDVNLNDGEPQCDPMPIPPVNTDRLYMAATYALLLLVAMAVRVYRAGASLPPMGTGIIITFMIFGALHPFWTGYRIEPSGCTIGASLESISISIAAVLALWMVVRRKERWDTPQPGPREAI
jgi:hypothetical protein